MFSTPYLGHVLPDTTQPAPVEIPKAYRYAFVKSFEHNGNAMIEIADTSERFRREKSVKACDLMIDVWKEMSHSLCEQRL